MRATTSAEFVVITGSAVIVVLRRSVMMMRRGVSSASDSPFAQLGLSVNRCQVYLCQ